MNTTKSKPLFATALVAVLFSATASAAGYLHIEGIKGESKNAEPEQPATQVESNQQAKPAGLLLPAVQRVRATTPSAPAPKDPPPRGGNAETTWKIEKGSK